MTAAKPLSDLARAEFEARLEAARAQLPVAEARAYSVARPDAGIATVANCYGQIAWWSRQLGHPRDEWMPALEKSAEWLIRRIEWIDQAGPPFRRKATDWESALRTAITTSNPDLEQRVLAIPFDLHDGSLGPVRRPFAEGLVGLLRDDDRMLAKAAADASNVPDEEAIKAKWYPRLGPALEAIHDRDADRLRSELNAVCAQHVTFATKGHLRLSEGAWSISPVIQLLLLARRRGIDANVDSGYHALRLRIRVGHVTEWEGRPVGRDAVVEAIVDPVPIDQLLAAVSRQEQP